MKTVKGRLFLFLIGSLVLITLFEIGNRKELLVFLVVGILLIYRGTKQAANSSLFTWFGWFLVGISLISTFSIWLLLGGLLFVLIFGGKRIFSGLTVESFGETPWSEKKFVGVTTAEPRDHSGEKFKQQWIGGHTIGGDVFEWDDINLTALMGDSIIDLGNTLLPDRDNVIMLRKGFGRTRIIVPQGVGVSINHSAVQGTVRFQGETINLSNESLTMYGDTYHSATRKIKIVSNVLFGDFEVIQL